MPEPHSEDSKRQAAELFWEHSGNLTEVSRITGIPRTTLIHWSQVDDVFSDTLKRINAQFDRQFAARATRIIEKGFKRLEDLIDDKDSKVTARDLAHTLAVTIDKRQLITNRPTSISLPSGKVEQRLKDMEKRLSAYQSRTAEDVSTTRKQAKLASFPTKQAKSA
jgi:hypothetical protein